MNLIKHWFNTTAEPASKEREYSIKAESQEKEILKIMIHRKTPMTTQEVHRAFIASTKQNVPLSSVVRAMSVLFHKEKAITYQLDSNGQPKMKQGDYNHIVHLYIAK